MFFLRSAKVLGSGAILSILFGCASARMSDKEADRLFKESRYDQAVTRLESGLKDQGEKGRDRLLYLFDLGLALHSAGRYKESIKIFLEADRLAEIKDYTSIAAESATLFTSDNIKDYKAEDFENVMISAYLALNYSLLGNKEDALVEARRVERKLYLMNTEGKRKYKQNAFAFYLSGVLYESAKEYDDAYISYKKAYGVRPGMHTLGRDLYRVALLARKSEDLSKWEKEYQLSDSDKSQARQFKEQPKKSEIVVVYQNGISPIKKPNRTFYQIPEFHPRYNPVRSVQVVLNGGKQEKETEVLEDIEQTAIENLREKYGGIIAKKLAGVVAKELVSDQIARQTKSPLLGMVAKIAMYASDQADLRSWNLLPRDLQIARFFVDPGEHTIKINMPGMGDDVAQFYQKKVVVESGKKALVTFRYMP